MRSHFLLGTLLAFASHSAFVRGFVVDNTQFYKSLQHNSIDIKGEFTLKSRLTNKYLKFTRQPTRHGGDSAMSIVTQSQPAVLGLEWISSKATSGKKTGNFAGVRIMSQESCISSQYGKSKPDRGGGDVVGVAYSCKRRGDPTIVKAMWFAFDCGSPSYRFVDLLERLRDHDSQKAGHYHWRKNNPGPAHGQRPRNQHRHRKPPHPRSRSRGRGHRHRSHPHPRHRHSRRPRPRRRPGHRPGHRPRLHPRPRHGHRTLHSHHHQPHHHRRSEISVAWSGPDAMTNFSPKPIAGLINHVQDAPYKTTLRRKERARGRGSSRNRPSSRRSRGRPQSRHHRQRKGSKKESMIVCLVAVDHILDQIPKALTAKRTTGANGQIGSALAAFDMGDRAQQWEVTRV